MADPAAPVAPAGGETGGLPAPAPGVEGVAPGGAQITPAEGEGDRVAGFLSRNPGMSEGDRHEIGRWHEGHSERGALADKVKELEGRPGELSTLADELVAQIPIGDQHLYGDYRRELGNDRQFVIEMLGEKGRTSKPDETTPPEETEEERIARLTDAGVKKAMQPYLQQEGRTRATAELKTLLDAGINALELTDEAKAFLRKDVEVQAHAAADNIRAGRSKDGYLGELVPAIIKERAEALSGLLSANGKAVTTNLVSQTVPAPPEAPEASRPIVSSDELAGMSVDDFWDTQKGQGDKAPAEGATG